MKQPEILAIITARGGSKGVPKKNLKSLHDKPLLVWSVEAAQTATCVTRVMVSSDDDDILSIGEQAGAEPLKRPAELATDDAKSEAVLLHVLKSLKETELYVPDYILLLQPTSPLRTGADIDQAFDYLKTGPAAELCISVTEIDNKYLKMYVPHDEHYIVGAVSKDHPYVPRQSLPKAYLPNGAIYLMDTAAFINQGGFTAEQAVPYIMPLERSVDIDSEEDFAVAESYLSESA
jgi:CMP-N,N'-diacetyllegionaminic acid synthase